MLTFSQLLLWTSNSTNVMNLQKGSLGSGDLYDGDHGQRDDGAEREHPADADGPARVLVVAVRHRGVADHAEPKDELK